MTIQETLAEGTRLLKSPCSEAFIDTPELDAALLLEETLHANRTELIVRGSEQMSEANRKNFFRLLSKRRNGECIAYILGRREFRGLEFAVNPHVLVPRPDTETLVEAALEYIEGLSQHERAASVLPRTLLDLCTGSGAVAISLKNERPFLNVTAADISPEALETASLNAARLLDTQLLNGGAPAERTAINFIQSDIFENISGRFDIIVSNPPYVPSGEIDTLAPEIRREPRLALDGGKDGLELIKKIISRAPEHLSPGGFLLLEADSEQMPAIRALLETNGFACVSIHRDLAGRERVISAGKAA